MPDSIRVFLKPSDVSSGVKDAVDSLGTDGVSVCVDKILALESAADRVHALDAAADRYLEADFGTADLSSEHSRIRTLLIADRYLTRAKRIASQTGTTPIPRWNFGRSQQLLVQAERLLVELTATAPDLVEAWTIRLTTSRLLELGTSETLRRYEKLAELEPHMYSAQAEMVTELSKAWHGDHEQMVEFARRVSSEAPDGSLAHAVLVDAHLNVWTDAGIEYAKHPTIVEEISEAGRKSVLNPVNEPSIDWYTAHSNFALFFSIVELPGHAALHFDAIGDNPLRAMWNHFEDGAGVFKLERGRAAKAARRHGSVKNS